MSPAESVVADWLMERGYTPRQVARALVAMSLLESPDAITDQELLYATNYGARVTTVRTLTCMAIRDGFLAR